MHMCFNHAIMLPNLSKFSMTNCINSDSGVVIPLFSSEVVGTIQELIYLWLWC